MPDTALPPLVARLIELVDADPRPRYQIAAAAGLPQSSITRLLTGEVVRPTAESVATIARTLGLSPTALGRLLYDCHPAGKAPEKYPNPD